MTNPALQLAKMTHKTQSLTGMPGGGPQEVTWEDVAGACAGLPRGPYLIAIAKFADDWSVLNELEYIVWMKVVDIANDPPGGKKWKRGNESLRKLGWLAIAENISPAQCQKCNGRGILYMPRGLIVPCHQCCGTGSGNSRSADLAREFGVTVDEWEADWDMPYRIVYALLYSWLGRSLGHIKKRLHEAQGLDMLTVAG